MSPLLPVPSDTRLPPSFGVRLSPRTRLCDGERTLVGGTAGGVLYLKPAAAGRVTADLPLLATDAIGAELCRQLLDRGFGDPCWADESDPDRSLADVTVVVPVRDRAGQLELLLRTLPEQVPVIVVDDGSRNPRVVAAVARAHGARLVVHPVNRGPAAARNTGLAWVATSLVAFCDSDVLPEPGWLARLLRHFDDPALAAVAPRVLGPAPLETDTWIERYEQARSSLDLGPTPAAVRPQGAVSYLPSACLVARVSALGRADDGGGFDEEMRVAEDVDLVWRLLGSGWRVRYAPEAVVRHQHRSRPGEWLNRKAFYGTGAALLAERHGSAVAPMVLSPWSALVAGALLVQRRSSLAVAACAVGVTVATISRKLGGSDHPVRAAATLTAEGTVATLHQTASALTRHYWPVAALAAVVSPRARRALLVAAVAEGVADYRRTRPDLDPIRYVAARRLDDLAYGTGLWLGAFRRRSVRALLPDVRNCRRDAHKSPRDARESPRPVRESPRPA